MRYKNPYNKVCACGTMEFFELDRNIVGNNTGILCVECNEPMKTLFHFCGLDFFYKRNASSNNKNLIGVNAKQGRTDSVAYQHFRQDTFNKNFNFHKNKIVFASDYLPDNNNINPYLSYIYGRYVLMHTNHCNDLDFVCCDYHQ